MPVPDIDIRQTIPWQTRWQQMVDAVVSIEARISALEGGGGEGYMLEATYDPTSVMGDAFDMDNMAEGSATKILTDDERGKLAAIEASADVTDATNVGAAIAGASAKATLVAADSFGVIDSEASNALKKSTFTNLMTLLSGTYLRLATAAQTITGGFRVTVYNIGTVASGTTTLDPGNRPLQKMTNNGASTLAPGSNKGAMILTILNAGSAGALTTSGWTKVSGDSFTTTNGHIFTCHVTVDDNGSHLQVSARQ